MGLNATRGGDMCARPTGNRGRMMRIMTCVTLMTAASMMPLGSVWASECPQVRETEYAPASVASMRNPLPASDNNLDDGEDLYEDDAKPVACEACHGRKGDGDGMMARMFSPSPRDFTCEQTMHQISDGQLYWIIKNGSIGTSMPAFDKLSDEDIWKLVHYIRTFAPLSADSGLHEKDKFALNRTER